MEDHKSVIKDIYTGKEYVERADAGVVVAMILKSTSFYDEQACQGTTSKAVVQPDMTNLPEKSLKQSYVSDRKDGWNLVAMELCFSVVVNE
ncbi:hypothetical protein Tco_1503028 [Tanacetum coccineum]